MAPSDTFAAQKRSLLLVAGSGRSGTSLITGLVGRLGVHIPKPEIKANESNPSGFGEPRWAVGFHKELLRSVDVGHEDARPQAWDITARVAKRQEARARLAEWLEEQFQQSDRVVVKDPRLAWFLELYRAVADDMSVDLSVVTMLRDPAETVRSRQLAYTSKIEGPTRMSGWLNMMLFVEHATRDVPRAIIRYDDLLTRWQETLSATERVLPFGLVSGASPEQIRNADRLVDPSLRRAAPDWAELHLPSHMRELAERTYRELDALAVSPGGPKPEPGSASLDAIRDTYVGYYRDSELLVRSSIAAARAAERRRMRRQERSKRRQGKAAQPVRDQQRQHPRMSREHVLAALKGRAFALLGKGRT